MYDITHCGTTIFTTVNGYLRPRSHGVAPKGDSPTIYYYPVTGTAALPPRPMAAPTVTDPSPDSLVAADEALRRATGFFYLDWNEVPGTGDADAARDAIAAGADVNKAYNYGRTPLQRASANGHESVVSVLIAAGADVNKANNGETPLHGASRNHCHASVVTALAEAGADVHKKDVAGNSPLDMLSRRGLGELAESLRRRALCHHVVAMWGYPAILARRLSGQTASESLSSASGGRPPQRHRAQQPPQGGAAESSIPVMSPQLRVVSGLDRIAVAQVLQLVRYGR